MNNRSRYKRRQLQTARAQARRNTAASTPAAVSEAAASTGTATQAAPNPRKREKIVDRLGRKRPATRLVLLGIALTVIFGAVTAAGVYYEFFPPSRIAHGSPITTKGGRNPTALFHGNPSAQVHDTQLILYSLKRAAKYGSALGKTSLAI